MSQLRSEIPFMASLWIRSGCDMKVDPSVETYQVGVHFEAPIKAILVAPSRILENFFSFHVSLPRRTLFCPPQVYATSFWTQYLTFAYRMCMPLAIRHMSSGLSGIYQVYCNSTSGGTITSLFDCLQSFLGLPILG